MSDASTDIIVPINIPLLCNCCPSVPCGAFLDRTIAAVVVEGANTCTLDPAIFRYFKRVDAMQAVLGTMAGSPFLGSNTPSNDVDTWSSSDCSGTEFAEFTQGRVTCNDDTIGSVIRFPEASSPAVLLEYSASATTANELVYEGDGVVVKFQF